MKETSPRAAAVAVAALCLFFILFEISLSSTRFLKYATTTTYSAKTTTQDGRYDLRSINGSTVLDPNIFTFFTMGPAQLPQVEKVQPYPRKFEGFIMSRIKNITLTSGPQSPSCKVQHNVPALVFSAGGYTGNFFHDFDDGFVPLFITVNTIFPDQDIVIVVSEAPNWWPGRYADLLAMFNKYPIIILKNTTATHCFPAATIGLIAHDFMTINQTPLPNQKSYMDFRVLLEKAYGPKAHPKVLTPKATRSRPKLVLTNRENACGRMITNHKQVIRLIEKVGFEVIVFNPKRTTPLHESYASLNSSHAMIGVHGASLTHSLFLRPGSVFIQVVPIGINWAAFAYIGRGARSLNLEYSEYKIGVNESSLVDKYGKENFLLKDPSALLKKGRPSEFMKIYLKEQNVKLDLERFKSCLKEAYTKAKRFMYKNG